MKASDIKIGHVYYVDYEPVKNGEFNGRHLSVVLKKNNDKVTFVVMPLTSSPNGDGVNKINIGKIAGLPPSIKTKDTYAVYNQVRTVNSMRFYSVKNGSMRLDVPMDNAVWLNLFELAIRDMIHNMNQDIKIIVLKNVYDLERFAKAKDLAYSIIKLQKAAAPDYDRIAALKSEIRETLKGATYTLDVKQSADGIQEIFNESFESEK